jgi:membrane-associated phospholipid phosphatase
MNKVNNSFLVFVFGLLLFLKPQKINAQNFDIDVLKQTNLHRNQNLDPFFCNFSNAISYVTPLVPITVYAAGLKTKNKNLQTAGIQIALSAGINGLLTYSAKQIVNRPRPGVSYPFLTPLESKTQYSMPSGHTSSSFNTATALSLEFPKWYIVVPAYTYAATMAYSRMHVGVHYPTDVLAGAALGVGSAFISKKATRFLQKNNRTKKAFAALLF